MERTIEVVIVNIVVRVCIRFRIFFQIQIQFAASWTSSFRCTTARGHKAPVMPRDRSDACIRV